MSDKPKTVLICVLCGGERHQWIHPSIHYGFLAMTQDGRFRQRHVPAVCLATHEATRNWATEECIRGGDDFLLMVDNDTDVSQFGHPINLMDLPAFDLDIVGAPVPVMKQADASGRAGVALNAYVHMDGVVYATSTMEDLSRALEPAWTLERWKEKAGREGLLERDALGSAVICIKREVLLAMRESNWMPEETTKYVVWDAGPPYPAWVHPRDATGNVKAGEDLLFCRRAKHLGFRVWASLNHFCGHGHTHDQRDIPEVAPMMGLRLERKKSGEKPAAELELVTA